ncbi:Probable integral membrane protein [hydrothermal vent metagenome]|uniref:Probable integral membrane protein n=1 Tax=hydrothermal vent metagenome TaxID=652676 RepID=A0A1W1CNY3_9ZZZZ
MYNYKILQRENIDLKSFSKITQTQLILLTSLFLVLFDNYAFFTNLIKVYPLSDNFGFVVSTVFVNFFFTVLLLSLVSTKWTIKPIVIIVLIVSSLTNYFMNAYHVVIDDSMIRNMMQTNIHESMDLLTFKQVLYFVFLGVLPSVYVYKVQIVSRGFKSELVSRLKLLTAAFVVIGGSIFLFSKYYTSFAREHKPLRFTVNPTYWIYSTGKYIHKTFNSGPIIVKAIGTDAKIVNKADDNRSKLVIMVVGEAARADHFSLNGYQRDTNPLLANDNIIDFPNMSSCGTSTAESVPCMFSMYDRGDYSYKKGITTENVLDVLKHTKDVAILWRDNNSDSKGVALRVAYEDFKIPKNNSVCSEGECRDIGMLKGLDQFIAKNKGKDILIVLHQMGNHGPAYFKRYPKAFEKFKPTCKTNQLEECTKQEIVNAYDNAILYTDYFLDSVIKFLKKYDDRYDTAMIYMSDHGESLGENGVYLHGLPYFMAPSAQTHIGAVMWFGKHMSKDINADALRERSQKAYSQDNLFHTLLGIFNVHTKVYDPDMDMLKK